MILPARFGVEDEHLMEVKRGLEEIVELDGSGEGYIGVIHEDIYRV